VKLQCRVCWSGSFCVLAQTENEIIKIKFEGLGKLYWAVFLRGKHPNPVHSPCRWRIPVRRRCANDENGGDDADSVIYIFGCGEIRVSVNYFWLLTAMSMLCSVLLFFLLFRIFDVGLLLDGGTPKEPATWDWLPFSALHPRPTPLCCAHAIFSNLVS